MSGEYSKCKRCKIHYHTDNGVTLNLRIASWDSDLGYTVDLCPDCLLEFKVFVKGEACPTITPTNSKR